MSVFKAKRLAQRKEHLWPERSIDVIHLIYGPKGKSFVSPRVLMFSERKSRETSGLEGKQN